MKNKRVTIHGVEQFVKFCMLTQANYYFIETVSRYNSRGNNYNIELYISYFYILFVMK